MFSLNMQLFIGPLPVIDSAHEIKIESGWQRFTDTATITLARKIRVLDGGDVWELPELILIGDPITIRYGYDGRYRTEFTGVVSAVHAGTPLVIECEDQMWYLKRMQMSHSWRSVTLKQLLTFIKEKYVEFFPPRGFDFEVLGDINLGKYTINQATAAQVFDDLKQRMGLAFFFREGVLIASSPYTKSAEVHKYHFQRNIIESDLVFMKASDLALHFRGTSIQADGTKLQGAAHRGNGILQRVGGIAGASALNTDFNSFHLRS